LLVYVSPRSACSSRTSTRTQTKSSNPSSGLDKLYEKYRALRSGLKVEESYLKKELDAYLAKQQTKQIAAAEKKAENRGLDVDFAASQAAVTRPQGIPGLNVRSKLAYEVTDLKKVPAYFKGAELRVLSKSAINACIKGVGVKGKIPGLRIFMKQSATK